MYSDFANLQKGTTIPQWWLERHLGVKVDEDVEAFNLARMGLGDTIARAIRNEQGIEVILRYMGRDLRILNDREAAVEAPSRVEQSVRKIRRTLRQARDIEIARLPPEQADRFEHDLRKIQYQADALTKSRRDSKSLLQPLSG